MKGIKVYQRPNRPAQVTAFLENLEPKFRDKLVLQLYRLSQTPRAELREPHYKHFSIERYQPLYEIADGLWSELCLRICHLGKSCS